ncbi:amidohydrolase family protein [Spirosoma sp. KCTC 42546]|uniref:dipeptidase n=1 Tax=Spirosoma sp. KCTC 42546 TaxID=2520506 RepID=UPI00115AEE8B|nr:membrane dipeptidase [Spirosoma sp. KCTC 42546]QDK80246.1 amidohydrolase family protein [Spirosoma sp. KCTC 42546]
MQTRKQFLKNICTIAAGASLLPVDELAAYARPAPKKSIYFDFHCHPGWSMTERNFANNGETVQTISDMKEGHLTSGFLALVADAPLIKPGPKGIIITRKFSPGDGWTEYKRQLQRIKEVFAQVGMPFSTDLNDLSTKSRGPIGYLAVEGGDFLDDQLSRIEEAYQDGVRSIQLVHYAQNGLGDLQTAETTFNGLSSFGKDVVKKMNELGMVIDVAHASFQTAKDVANLTKSPIILSHSILQMEADRPIALRAISKEHAKFVADTGGVIGAWPSGFNKSFDEYVDNIKRLIDVVGIDHVGIGTDMSANFQPVLTNYTQYPQVAEALKAKGLTSQEVDKIMGENARVVLGKIAKSSTKK